MPTTSPEERKRLLSFVVCGGGPTGVETAAEIYDLCKEDIFNYVSSPASQRIRLPNAAVLQFPKVCGNDVSIHVVQSREHILNTVRRPIIRMTQC